MKQARLEVQPRTVFGKGAARSMRRSGKIPGILYGRNQNVVSLEIKANTLRAFLRSHGENILVDLAIDGQNTETAVIKELQKDPVKRNLLHADFLRVDINQPITSRVPIEIVGSAEGLEEGGIVTHLLRELNVTCIPTKIPPIIEIDTTSLSIGDSIRVKDLELDEDIVINDDPVTQIVSVLAPRVEVEVTEELVEGEEAEEGTETEEDETTEDGEN